MSLTEEKTSIRGMVLLLENSQEVIDSITEQLLTKQFHIFTVATDEELIQQLQADNDYCVIIANIHMGSMEPKKLMRAIQKNTQAPIIALTDVENFNSTIGLISTGANDYAIKNENVGRSILFALHRVLEQKMIYDQNYDLMEETAFINEELENIVDKMTQIGIELGSAKHLDAIIPATLTRARDITGADSAMFFMMDGYDTLRCVGLQSASLNISLCAGSQIHLPAVAVGDGCMLGQCVAKMEMVRIDDYGDENSPRMAHLDRFAGVHDYKIIASQALPIVYHGKSVLGVIQLINPLDKATGEPSNFPEEVTGILTSMVLQAAVAIKNGELFNSMEALFLSVVEVLAAAIDEKSPVTRGHIQRVANITMAMAEAIHEDTSGTYKDQFFTEDEMQELRIAGLLHDVGKITSPDIIISKGKKLETQFDRSHMVKERFLKFIAQVDADYTRRELSATKQGKDEKHITAIHKERLKKMSALDADMRTIMEANNPEEFMSDDLFESLIKVHAKRVIINGKEEALITDEEFKNLSIRKGSITPEEMDIMREHAAITIKLLEKIPFTEKYKNVVEYAGGHHERLDGTGYPRGLKAEEIPLQSRILALADFFEALTAKDRPYKKRLSIEQTMSILEGAAERNHIDPALFRFFREIKLHEEFAE